MAATSPFRRLMRYALPYRVRLTVAVLASLLGAFAAAAWAWLLGPVLDSLLTQKPVIFRGYSLDLGASSWALPLAIVVLALVKALSGWLHGGLMQGAAQGVLSSLRRQLYGHVLSLPPSYFETRHSGELLSRFTSDVLQVEFSVSQAMSSWVKDSLQVLAMIAVCAATDVRLFALVFVVVPAMAWPVSRFAKALKKTASGTQSSLGALTAFVGEQLHNLPVVQAYGRQPASLRRFDEEQRRYLGLMKRSLFVRGAFTPTLELMGIFGIAACIWVGTRAVASEPELAPKLLSFLTAALLLYQPLKALSGTFSQVTQGLAGAERLFEVLDAAPEDDAGAPAPSLTDAITLRDVRVQFADGRIGLHGASLHIPAGKTVALIGPSGAGKTTVLQVLLRFCETTHGAAEWNGLPLSSLSRSSLRARMAWVPQEPVLLSGSVRDNLLLAKPDAAEPQLWRALERAHADAFVKALPSGLDEQVGERGSRLSGGQRQRLAIARAFLMEPQVLLLDEPTAALDASAEAEVQAGLRELMQGRTVVVVAHRLSTVRTADLIYVLERGQVVEHGSPNELLQRGGAYSRMMAATA